MTLNRVSLKIAKIQRNVAGPVIVNASILWAGDLCVVWLREDWTRDRGKWISLNSDFIQRILHKGRINVEITVVVSHQCSFCWVSKVYVVKSLRLSCLLVCVNSMSRRWGWSLCLVQILGVAVWSGCRCCWRRLMMWTYWLLRLDDQCLSCAVLWFNQGGISKSPWSIVASPSSESLMD